MSQFVALKERRGVKGGRPIVGGTVTMMVPDSRRSWRDEERARQYLTKIYLSLIWLVERGP
jgi:hypothetical protein